MNKKKQGLIDFRRRALVKSGLIMGASALAFPGNPSRAEEAIRFPSKDEILPVEWSGAGECVFTAVSIEGPYDLEGAEVRRDIRDDQPGQDLLLRLQIVDVTRCIPLPDAFVQIWHCNATGWYSGYNQADPDELPVAQGLANHVPEQSKERFLRGAQVTDEDGRCEFLTVYPGWYAGRTVHVHAKVHFNDSRLLTSQLYFPQDLNDEVHETGAYKERGVSPYRNSTDAELVRSSGAAGSWPAVSREADRYVATLRIGVLNPYFDRIAPG